jgi:hypothetical protein
MAYLPVTGPAHIYVGKRPAGDFLYLGTAELAPSIQIVPAFQPVFNDIGGELVEFDSMYDGEKAIVAADINRYNEAVLAAMQARPFHTADSVPGFGNRLSRGTLMLQGGNAYPLYLKYSFFGTTNAVPGMPAGCLFHAAMLSGPDAIIPGTRVKKVSCVWTALPLYTATGANAGSFNLYTLTTADPAGLPAPD